MSDIKFTVANPQVDDIGSITTPLGGTWTAGTYSFKVCALYSDDNQQVDNYGVDRGVVAGWENVTVGVGDSVVISVNIDTTRSFDFVVLVQSGTTFDETASADIITETGNITYSQVTRTQWVITIDSEASTETLTIGASATTLELSPPAYPTVSYRQPFQRAYDGSLIKESFLDSRIIDSLTINANSYLSVGTNLTTLQRWMKDQIYLKVEDTNTETTSYFSAVYGTIGSLSVFNTRTYDETIEIFIPVDTETV